jgi:hypothetical protein
VQWEYVQTRQFRRRRANRRNRWIIPSVSSYGLSTVARRNNSKRGTEQLKVRLRTPTKGTEVRHAHYTCRHTCRGQLININRKLHIPLLYSICTSCWAAIQGVQTSSATQTAQLIFHTHTHLTEIFRETTLEVLTTACSRRPACACFAGTHCLYLQVDTHMFIQKDRASNIYVYWWETWWSGLSWLTWLFNTYSWFITSSSGYQLVARRSFRHLSENGLMKGRNTLQST